jgi:hypothetical protein
MEPEKDEQGELLDTPAARAAEGVMWLVVGATTAAHVYRVVVTRSLFGGVDTLAALVVAVLLLAVVRAIRRR